MEVHKFYILCMDLPPLTSTPMDTLDPVLVFHTTLLLAKELISQQKNAAVQLYLWKLLVLLGLLSRSSQTYRALKWPPAPGRITRGGCPAGCSLHFAQTMVLFLPHPENTDPAVLRCKWETSPHCCTQ